ncbi:MAG: ABC transporter permease subunit [Fibrobacterota bacterium]
MLKNNPTLKYVINRVLWYALTFFVAITITFFLPRLGGTDPVTISLSGISGGLSPEQVRRREEDLNKRYNLARLDTSGNVVRALVDENGDFVRDDEGNLLRTMSIMGRSISVRPLVDEAGNLVRDDRGNIVRAQVDEQGEYVRNEDGEHITLSKDTSDNTILVEDRYFTIEKYSDGALITDSDGDPIAYEAERDGTPIVSPEGTITRMEIDMQGNPVTDEDGDPVFFEDSVDVLSVNPAKKQVAVVKAQNVDGRLALDDENSVERLSGVRHGDLLRNAEGDVVVGITDRQGTRFIRNENGEIKTAKRHGDVVRYGLFNQYLRYMRMILKGDLGISIAQDRPVMEIIRESLPWTLALQFPAIVLGWLVGNTLGVLAAYKRGLFDKILFPISQVSTSIPFFVFGMILVYVMAIKLNLFPAFGGYAWDQTPGFTAGFILSALYHFILPFFSIFPVIAGGQAIGMRSMSIYELGTDYIKFARTLGVKEHRIIKYIFRNAMLPQLTGLAVALGQMVGGALIAELIFSYPGLGTALLDAVYQNDYFVIQAGALVMAIFLLISNFTVDIIIGVFDPRVKAGRVEGN